jgi:hypothetical protein
MIQKQLNLQKAVILKKFQATIIRINNNNNNMAFIQLKFYN